MESTGVLVKSSTETIAEALRGDWRSEHLFALRQALELYDLYQEKIQACDEQIEAYMASLAAPQPPQESTPPAPPRAITATARKLAVLIYRMFRYGMDYVDQGQQAYEQQYQKQKLNLLRKQARQMGYAIVSLQSGEVVS